MNNITLNVPDEDLISVAKEMRVKAVHYENVSLVLNVLGGLQVYTISPMHGGLVLATLTRKSGLIFDSPLLSERDRARIDDLIRNP